MHTISLELKVDAGGKSAKLRSQLADLLDKLPTATGLDRYRLFKLHHALMTAEHSEASALVVDDDVCAALTAAGLNLKQPTISKSG